MIWRLNVEIIRYTTSDSPAPLVGVRDEGQVFGLPGVPSLAALWALPLAEIRQRVRDRRPVPAGDVTLLPPVDGRTEVWAAGVTYVTSREARVEESERPADVYRQVYEAERPELFFKSAAWRVIGDGQTIAVRADSVVDVPEPEVALVINRFGEVAGYTACNDVSSRSIEGENPLYLPQAKVFTGSCAVGPALVPVTEVPDLDSVVIDLHIARDGDTLFRDSVPLSAMKRRPEELLEWLFSALEFPVGVVLLTGTSIVPPPELTLKEGDVVDISISGVGTLTNPVVEVGRPMPRALMEAPV